jgi:hypothetical protein
MIYRLSIFLAHATSIHDNHLPLPKIIYRVRIFLNATNQTKKATLGGAWVLHTLFQGKPLHATLDRAPNNSLTLNIPFLDNLSSLPIRILIVCNIIWKEKKKKRERERERERERNKQRLPLPNHEPLCKSLNSNDKLHLITPH